MRHHHGHRLPSHQDKEVRARGRPMANQKQPDRLQSSLLAALLAVAGSLFFFDKLDELFQTIHFSWPRILHLAPAFLVFVAIVLTLADRNVMLSARDRRAGENRHD
jgi:hypothetical protein